MSAVASVIFIYDCTSVDGVPGVGGRCASIFNKCIGDRQSQVFVVTKNPLSRNFASVPFELDQREGENARRLEASGKEVKNTAFTHSFLTGIITLS